MIIIATNHHVSFSIVPTLSSSLSPPPSFLIDHHHHLSLNAAYDGLITGRGVHNLLEVPGVIEGTAQ